MKKLTLLFIFLSTSILSAQDITDWQIGVNVNPFIFNRILLNRIDSDHSFYETKETKQDLPNGFAFGLTFEKNWNEHWGIKTGIEYSKQNQKYDNFFYNGNVITSTVNANFDYYKIPITVQFYTSIKKHIYLTFNQGFQVSLLDDYRTVIDSDFETEIVIPNIINGFTKVSFVSPMSFYYVKNDMGWIYKNRTYGLIGSIGLKGFLSEKISYTTHLKYEYDISAADTEKTFFLDNHDTHNLRIGIEFGVQYHLEINDIFDKSPIKL